MTINRKVSSRELRRQLEHTGPTMQVLHTNELKTRKRVEELEALAKHHGEFGADFFLRVQRLERWQAQSLVGRLRWLFTGRYA